MIHNLHGLHESSEHSDAHAKRGGSQRVVRVGFDRFVGACHVYAEHPHHTRNAIDLDAESPEDAAREAYRILLDPTSMLPIFTVTEESGGPALDVDLDEIGL